MATNKHYHELQEYIETIKTTATLLDYKIEIYHDTTILSHPENPKIVLKLFTYPSIILRTAQKGSVAFLSGHSQEEKVEHLQQILQSL